MEQSLLEKSEQCGSFLLIPFSRIIYSQVKFIRLLKLATTAFLLNLISSPFDAEHVQIIVASRAAIETAFIRNV
jgi:hypothetical protein